MLLLNLLLNETHLIASYVSGLKPELKPLMGLSNPTTTIVAYESAKSYETSFKALQKAINLRTSQNSQHQINLSKTPVPFQGTSNPSPFHKTFAPNQYQNNRTLAPKTRVPFKPKPITENLKEQNLCFRCHDPCFPGHVCKPKTIHAITWEGNETGIEAQNMMLDEGENSSDKVEPSTEGYQW